MAAARLFDDVDAALMAHPYYTYEKSGTSLAMDALQFEFAGKPAHAAASPYEGINALDAVIMLFNSINALRQQTQSDARIHGIITEGGVAANIIPERALAQFYVRSLSRSYTNELIRKVKLCAEGAALQTGCKLSISNYEYSYDELLTNQTMSNAFTANLIEMGVAPEEITSGKDNGSLDLGNVSTHCPTVHPFIKVIDAKHQLHTKEFRDLAMTPRALNGMLFAAKALALTAYDLISQPDLLERVKTEFAASQNKSS